MIYEKEIYFCSSFKKSPINFSKSNSSSFESAGWTGGVTTFGVAVLEEGRYFGRVIPPTKAPIVAIES